MQGNNRDMEVLDHILEYCQMIQDAHLFFSTNRAVFFENSIYRNAVAMCLLQIGELVGNLTDGFKDEYHGAPWRNIRGLRNIIAHEYGYVNTQTIWEISTKEIGDLASYCKMIREKCP